jgi:hypothetical protein
MDLVRCLHLDGRVARLWDLRGPREGHEEKSGASSRSPPPGGAKVREPDRRQVLAVADADAEAAV